MIVGWSGTNKTSWVRRHGMTCRARERERKARKGHQRDRETREIGLCLDICLFQHPTLINHQAWDMRCAVCSQPMRLLLCITSYSEMS